MARSGELALKAISKQKPDLILLDIDMPGMNGLEVCLQLKCNKETVSIPVIFVSALDQSDIKVMGLETGGVDYITKPFLADEVVARVRIHLEISDLRKKLDHTVNQLVEGNNLLQSITSTLSQEMRTELASLSQTSNNLANDLESGTEAKKKADEIIGSTERLGEIFKILFLLATSTTETTEVAPAEIEEIEKKPLD